MDPSAAGGAPRAGRRRASSGPGAAEFPRTSRGEYRRSGPQQVAHRAVTFADHHGDSAAGAGGRGGDGTFPPLRAYAVRGRSPRVAPEGRAALTSPPRCAAGAPKPAHPPSWRNRVAENETDETAPDDGL